MGAYVCPSCGEGLVYSEMDLTTNPNWKAISGECMNKNTCGVEKVTIIIDKKVEEDFDL